MTSMFAFPGMFKPHIEDSNLKLPDDFEDYDPEQYPHFHVFMLTHLCQPIYIWALEENANIIAAISEDEIRQVTFEHLIKKGIVYGVGNLV